MTAAEGRDGCGGREGGSAAVQREAEGERCFGGRRRAEGSPEREGRRLESEEGRGESDSKEPQSRVEPCV